MSISREHFDLLFDGPSHVVLKQRAAWIACAEWAREQVEPWSMQQAFAEMDRRYPLPVVPRVIRLPSGGSYRIVDGQWERWSFQDQEWIKMTPEQTEEALATARALLDLPNNPTVPAHLQG